jgi:hypothetical protein
MSNSLGGLARRAWFARLARFPRLGADRVVGRVRRSLARALVLRGRVGVLWVLRRGSGKANGGRKDGCGELHGIRIFEIACRDNYVWKLGRRCS